MSDMSKKKRGISSLFKGKKFRHGSYAAILTILFIAIVTVLNYVAGAAESKWGLRIDATPNQVTKFSDQTYAVLDGIDQDVYLHLVYQADASNSRRIALEEIINKYQARNSHIKVDTIDPLRDPTSLNKYTEKTDKTLGNGTVILTNADESRVKIITASEMNSYSMDQSSGQYYVSGFSGESKLTTALMYVTSETTPIVYVLTGHDELNSASYCTMLKGQLQSENYDVLDLTLGPNAELKAGDTVLINVPQRDLTDEEYIQLKDFLSAGGRMMFVNSYETNVDKLPNFKSLLDFYGVGFEYGLVVEDEAATTRWLSMPTYVIPDVNSEHDITSTLSTSSKLLLPMTGAVKQQDMPLSGYQYDKLLTSSDTSYLKDLTGDVSSAAREEGDRSGPFALAMSVLYRPDVEDATKDTRIVLVANPYLVVDSSYMTATINLDFTMNAFDWLANREPSVYIRTKSNADTTLQIPDAGTFWLLAAIIVVVIPVLVLIVGVVMHIRRRRL